MRSREEELANERREEGEKEVAKRRPLRMNDENASELPKREPSSTFWNGTAGDWLAQDRLGSAAGSGVIERRCEQCRC